MLRELTEDVGKGKKPVCKQNKNTFRKTGNLKRNEKFWS